MREINISELNINPMTLISDEWMLLTAGTEDRGYNTMTCSWGHMGAIWGHGKGLPTAVCYVRPQRYTKEFVDREPLYTLSFFDGKKKELAYLGTHSGRDEDKITKTGLTPVFGDGFTYFAEAKLVLVCRKLYRAPVKEEGFIDKDTMEDNYPSRDFHDLYIGEIVKVLAADQGELAMEMLEMMKTRRSIRKYLPQRVEREKLEKIQEAGIFAPNPGGGQGTKIIIVDNPELIEKIGIVNANVENRNWGGKGVSVDQPSIIDDLSIRSGFYGSPALGIVCVPRARKDQVNAIGSAFVCAQNMVMEAYDLGVSSCIVGRAEATFSQSGMQDMLDSWGLDPEYMPMVFVCLGYINGAYPKIKPRNEGRALWISD